MSRSKQGTSILSWQSRTYDCRGYAENIEKVPISLRYYEKTLNTYGEKVVI